MLAATGFHHTERICVFARLLHSTTRCLQVFESVNGKVSARVNEFLDSISGPYSQALDKGNKAAEKLTGVVAVAQGLVNNEVFKAVVSGLEDFNKAVTRRVSFEINLGTFCLWVSGRASMLGVCTASKDVRVAVRRTAHCSTTPPSN